VRDAKVLEESPPEAVAVMKDLQLAWTVVGKYFNTHGSYSGLDPASASAISSEVMSNASPVAIPGEVSLRVSGPQSLVLASATADGAIYSVCMDGGGASVYGRNDTSDPHGCTNGWPDPSAKPPPTEGKVRIATGSDPNGNLWSLTLLEMSGPGAETPFELELLIGPSELAPAEAVRRFRPRFRRRGPAERHPGRRASGERSPHLGVGDRIRSRGEGGASA